ncbi:MAG: tetratricopeptide repeat protein [Bryobacteraceae bacterium]
MTRHELKEQLQHDHFTDAVSEVVSYAFSNPKRLIRWIVLLVLVLILAGGALWFAAYQKSIRQEALAAALHVIETPVATSSSHLPNSYPTQEAKQQAEIKILSNMITKYSGSREGLITQYYLGTVKAERKDPRGAESDLRRVADSKSDFAPLAKIALAQLYAGENRMQEAKGLLQSIANKPSDLVSKAQADILLAQLNLTTNPQEAKKILQSLRGPNQPPSVSRAVDQLSGELMR